MTLKLPSIPSQLIVKRKYHSNPCSIVPNITNMGRIIHEFDLGLTPLETIPPGVRDVVRKFLPSDERCKVSNPIHSINIEISTLLNASTLMLVVHAIERIKLLSLAQCIVNGACQWLDHVDIFNLFMATISCASCKNHNLPISLHPTLPLPSSLITDRLFLGNDNFIEPKHDDSDSAYGHLHQNKWDDHIGICNRVIGGPGILLMRGDKNYLELNHGSKGIIMPME